MQQFASLPVARKIQVIIVATAGLLLLVASAVHAVYTSYDRYRAAEHHALSVAALVANNAGARLDADGAIGAQDLLSTLRAERDVESAVLLDRSGFPIAEFSRAGPSTAARAAVESPVTAPVVTSNWRRITVAVPILDRSSKSIGASVVVFHLDRLHLNLGINLLVVLLVAVFVILMAWPLARRVARTISGPIEELNEAMTAVSSTTRFETRLEKRANDEIGSLFERFNQMLAELEQRDRHLEQHRSELEAAVAERTQAFEDANDRLRSVIADLERARARADAANQAKSRFMAIMSHEIRSPMNGVVGMVELLRQTVLTPRQQHYCATIGSSSKALLAILNDILDFSRIEAGGMQIECLGFNVDDLLQDTLQLFAEDAQGRSIELVCDNRLAGSTVVKGDSYRLRQVLTNLLSNALKFTDGGNVVARVVEIERDQQTARLRFEVIDTGIGMSSEVLERIFDSFVQADDSTSRRFGGTGLGLSISRELIRLMGGELQVESRPNLGSRFWFDLDFPTVVMQPSDRGFGLAGQRVLIVDDNPALVEMLEQRLKAWEVDVEIAGSTTEFIDAFRRTDRPSIDLVLLDEEIRDNLALPLLDHLEASGVIPAVPIILMSNHAVLEELDSMSTRHSVVRVITKPVQQSDLFDALTAVLTGQITRGRQSANSQRHAELFAGRTALVAEDNLVNQEVAEELLASLGFEVTIAADGAQALQIFEQLRPAVVFMDCQMPHVDGYQASQAIRDFEVRSALTRTPIIALTANALAGDRERCVDSGMDDFLSKPFQLDDLVTLLRRWLAVTEPTPAEEVPTVVPADAISLDPACVGQLRSIDARKPGFFARIASGLRDDADELDATFRQWTSSRDADVWDRVAFVAHRTKSAVATIGAADLAQLLGEVELAARDRTEHTLREKSRLVIETLPPVLTALNALIPPAAKSSAVPVDDEKAKSTSAGTLLLAEDDEATALMLREALAAAGYIVHHASRGDVAIAKLGQTVPDIVLLDVLMPGMDGFEVLKWMRGEAHWQDLPVIVMTGLNDSDSVHQAYLAGATDFIVKPVAVEVLINRLRYIQRSVAMARALQRNERRLRRAQDSARVSYWEWNPQTQRLFLGEGFRFVLGLGSEISELSIEDLEPYVGDAEMRETMHRLRDGKPVDSVSEFSLNLPTGQVMRVLQHVEKFTELDDGSQRVMGTVQDVTQLRDSQQRVRILSHFDAVTGLPNESFLRRSLALLLSIATRNDAKTALLLIDIGEYQRIATALGETVSNQFLAELGTRLESHTRSSDVFEVLPDTDSDLVAGSSPVAAVSGHRFSIALANVKDSRDVARAAERIIHLLTAPVKLGEHEFYPKVCVGVAVAPDDSANGEELQQHALAALTAQIQRGPGYLWYSERADKSVRDRLSLERSLRHAIVHQEIEPYFQPLMDARTLQPVAVEALARWRRDGELVSPADFIPIAEETGLINPLGELMLRGALAVIAQWRARGLTEIGLSVNVSGRQFKETDVPRLCELALRDAGLDATALEVELTEGVLVDSSAEMLVHLRALRAQGVRLALDDFGTGFSSLAYLNRFPINVLKIDRGFVMRLLERPDNQAIVRASIGLAHDLGMEVVAEGVETEAQVNWLRGHGCDRLQGYYFSKPLPKGEFEQWWEDYVPPDLVIERIWSPVHLAPGARSNHPDR